MNLIRKHILLTMLIVVWLALFVPSMYELVSLSLDSETHSHIVMIPFVSIYLLCLNRKKIFMQTALAQKHGFIVVCMSLVIYAAGVISVNRFALNDYLFFPTLAGIAFIIGIFIWLAGLRAFKSAAFALLFLLFMVPIPLFILDGFIKLLQACTAEMTDVVFKVIGMPVFREGLVFSLTDVSIEVAKQCSGIRSSLVLIIISVLVGYMYLNSNWRRVALVVAVIPISIFKNALRIVLLAWMGNYVDISWLTDSALHSRGGIPFMFVALLFLLPVLWLLRIGERKSDLNKSCGEAVA
ncbi:MAG: exosortase [Desulfobacteraceae bacterium]|nr:MAG: exosortase [Desulfobacteraceae bacterium]